MAEGPDASSLVYVGVCKSFNGLTGWGFIKCPQTEMIYGKDIILLNKNKDDSLKIRPGDEISFSVMDGPKGPEAVNISVRSSGNFPEIRAEEELPGWFVGNVRSYNPLKGWGFVSSPQTFKIFGKDIFLMHTEERGVKVNAADRVRFTVRRGPKGPEVDNLQRIRENGEVIEETGPRPRKGKGKGKGKGLEGEGDGEEDAAEALDSRFVGDPPNEQMEERPQRKLPGAPVYHGTVKSYNAQKGWGFIKCAETEQLYDKDIFLLSKHVGGQSFSKGEPVSFSVFIGERGPEAVDITPAWLACEPAPHSPHAPPAPSVNPELYNGSDQIYGSEGIQPQGSESDWTSFTDTPMLALTSGHDCAPASAGHTPVTNPVDHGSSPVALENVSALVQAAEAGWAEIAEPYGHAGIGKGLRLDASGPYGKGPDQQDAMKAAGKGEAGKPAGKAAKAEKARKLAEWLVWNAWDILE